MRRRRVLTTVGATIPIALGGCIDGGDDEADSGTTETPSASENGATPTDTDASVEQSETGAEWPSEPYAEYDTTPVHIRTADGDLLGEVTAAIADTGSKRYLGLSDAESLPDDGGMLFVFDSPGSRTFVMREMDFGIDIVYADAEGTITSVHYAPAPGPDEDGNSQGYSGHGQYVLEVPYRWTARRGIGVGDVLDFEL